MRVEERGEEKKFGSPSSGGEPAVGRVSLTYRNGNTTSLPGDTQLYMYEMGTGEGLLHMYGRCLWTNGMTGRVDGAQQRSRRPVRGDEANQNKRQHGDSG